MDDNSIQPYAQQSTGMVDLINLDFGSPIEMARRLNEMEQKMTLVQNFFQKVMVKGIDYGKIPSVEKPFLQKPGAEKLCFFFNYSPIIKEKVETKDPITMHYTADIIMQLVHRGTNIVIAEGLGTASTYESKYRYRWVSEYKLPKGIDKESLVSDEREEWKDGKKTGKKFWMYRLENDDLPSIWNTILKMAKKRAFIDVTLTGTYASSIFAMESNAIDAWAAGVDPDTGELHGDGPPPDGNTAPPSKASKPEASNSAPVTQVTKSKVLSLMKKAELDWDGLAVQATEKLGRPIKKVMKDMISESDWSAVAIQLELFIDTKSAFAEADEESDELDFEKLPPDLRGAT